MPLTKAQKGKIHDSNLKQQAKSEAVVEEVLDERTAAFNHMADKEKVAKSLTCTKACRNVTREKETGEFGMCWRKVCTFAHSEAEMGSSWPVVQASRAHVRNQWMCKAFLTHGAKM